MIIYNSKKFQQQTFTDISEPNIYLSSFLNNFLKTLVDSSNNYSVRVIGLDCFFIDLIDNEFFKVVITPGKAIINSSLVELDAPTVLDIALDPAYDQIIVNMFLDVAKFKVELYLYDSINNKTNRPFSNNSGILLSRFSIIRRDNQIVKISHPYGEWKYTKYSEFLKSISPETLVLDTFVYSKLISDLTLREPFKLNDSDMEISVPLFFEEASKKINKSAANKLKSKSLISDLYGFYYSKNDINIKYRTEIFDPLTINSI